MNTSHSTRWSIILLAQGQGRDARAALGELIGHYENFVVWLIRQYKRPPDTTPEELKQEFLERVLRHNDIAKLDRARGSFRGWLRRAVQNFLANEWDKWKAARAGRKGTSPIGLKPIDAEAPLEEAAEREFARQVILRALELLRAEQRDKARFDELARFLPGPQMELVELAPFAATRGMTPNALAKAICLLRARFRELLRAAIRDLLDLDSPPSPDAPGGYEVFAAARRAETSLIDDELRDLRRYFWS